MVVFCEYVILNEHRDEFLQWVKSQPERWRNVELMENTAQPGVFVEWRRAAGEEEALAIEKERREGRSGWREMESWAKKGAEGIRVWIFRPVTF
ncbi:hypothetical protein [Cohnella thailandensis]|jgi:hypothetical protein|uniref:ABM domain-containing protein n=1 Tax=Cohnella thailandensis TaxID=557557 RepID=A0A841SLE2_9BACL|nr:hypothetical protein [Cohnella thailandensis]MBB6632734.1 hypothetical protein [Cohnella thailandensis]MBP1975577.1 hypothetical protein [Cohnella thailandensis]